MTDYIHSLRARLYFEAHITIDASDTLSFEVFKECLTPTWKVSRFDEDEVDGYDGKWFASARDTYYPSIYYLLKLSCEKLKEKGFNVIRYKIEDTLFDSKHGDDLNIKPDWVLSEMTVRIGDDNLDITDEEREVNRLKAWGQQNKLWEIASKSISECSPEFQALFSKMVDLFNGTDSHETSVLTDDEKQLIETALSHFPDSDIPKDYITPVSEETLNVITGISS